MQAEVNGSFEGLSSSLAMHTIEMDLNSHLLQDNVYSGFCEKNKTHRKYVQSKALFQQTTPVSPTHIYQVNVRQLGCLIQY